MEKEFLVRVTYSRDYVRLQGSEVKVIMTLSKIQELVGEDSQRIDYGDEATFHTEQPADKEKWTMHSGSHPEGLNAKIEKKVEDFVALGFGEDAVRSVIKKSGPQLSQDELMTKLLQMKKACPQGGSQDPPVARTPTAAELTPPPPLVNSTDQRLRPVIIDGSNVAMR